MNMIKLSTLKSLVGLHHCWQDDVSLTHRSRKVGKHWHARFFWQWVKETVILIMIFKALSDGSLWTSVKSYNNKISRSLEPNLQSMFGQPRLSLIIPAKIFIHHLITVIMYFKKFKLIIFTLQSLKNTSVLHENILPTGSLPSGQLIAGSPHLH